MRLTVAGWCLAFALASAPILGQNGTDLPRSAACRAGLEEAAAWVHSASRTAVQYDYIVTAAVRFLLLWVSRDDVGQGYIRIGTQSNDPQLETIHLLMGSDPAKAPLGINRWGAAVEVLRRRDGSGAFFGFMKASKGESASAAREELSRENQAQRYQFEGIIGRVGGGRAVSTAVPISSGVDFTLHQLPLAEQMVMEQLKIASRPPRFLDTQSLEGCSTGSGFLFTVRELISASLSEQRPPITRCFIYHARRYLLTLDSCEPEAELKIALKLRGSEKTIEKTYQDLRQAHFRVLNTGSGQRTDFRVIFGNSGHLRGVPVQIEYQPNWWFRVTLNLNPTA